MNYQLINDLLNTELPLQGTNPKYAIQYMEDPDLYVHSEYGVPPIRLGNGTGYPIKASTYGIDLSTNGKAEEKIYECGGKFDKSVQIDEDSKIIQRDLKGNIINIISLKDFEKVPFVKYDSVGTPIMGVNYCYPKQLEHTNFSKTLLKNNHPVFCWHLNPYAFINDDNIDFIDGDPDYAQIVAAYKGDKFQDILCIYSLAYTKEDDDNIYYLNLIGSALSYSNDQNQYIHLDNDNCFTDENGQPVVLPDIIEEIMNHYTVGSIQPLDDKTDLLNDRFFINSGDELVDLLYYYANVQSWYDSDILNSKTPEELKEYIMQDDYAYYKLYYEETGSAGEWGSIDFPTDRLLTYEEYYEYEKQYYLQKTQGGYYLYYQLMKAHDASNITPINNIYIDKSSPIEKDNLIKINESYEGYDSYGYGYSYSYSDNTTDQSLTEDISELTFYPICVCNKIDFSTLDTPYYYQVIAAGYTCYEDEDGNDISTEILTYNLDKMSLPLPSWISDTAEICLYADSVSQMRDIELAYSTTKNQIQYLDNKYIDGLGDGDHNINYDNLVKKVTLTGIQGQGVFNYDLGWIPGKAPINISYKNIMPLSYQEEFIDIASTAADYNEFSYADGGYITWSDMFLTHPNGRHKLMVSSNSSIRVDYFDPDARNFSITGYTETKLEDTKYCFELFIDHFTSKYCQALGSITGTLSNGIKYVRISYKGYHNQSADSEKLEYDVFITEDNYIALMIHQLPSSLNSTYFKDSVDEEHSLALVENQLIPLVNPNYDLDEDYFKTAFGYFETDIPSAIFGNNLIYTISLPDRDLSFTSQDVRIGGYDDESELWYHTPEYLNKMSHIAPPGDNYFIDDSFKPLNEKDISVQLYYDNEDYDNYVYFVILGSPQLISQITKDNFNIICESPALHQSKLYIAPYYTGKTTGEIFNDYDNNVAKGLHSHAEGEYTLAEGIGAHTEGGCTVAKGIASHAEGYKTSARAAYSHTEGYETYTYSDGAHAEGYETYARSTASHAEGYGTETNSQYAHAEGYYTDADGTASHAEGYYTEANGAEAHAEGYFTDANGKYSHAEGSYTRATADGAHAEGSSTNATNSYAHAEGGSTTASGVYSHAEGNNSFASGSYSHAEGQSTRASGSQSHAEGYNTYANGQYSHTEGYNTYANGQYSHAEGYQTSDNYYTYAHVEGANTIAGNAYQHVQGKYNVATSNMAHVVGGGTSTSARKNIHTLDWSGNAVYAGDVKSTNSSGTQISLNSLAAEVAALKQELAALKS